MSVDKIITDAVFADERAVGVTSTHANYLVGTGQWRMVEDGEDLHILFTDDFMSPEEVMDVIVQEDCEVVEGERLIMYTNVRHIDRDFSLVVFRSRIATEGPDETNVG